MTLLKSRIYNQLNFNQPREQAGFRKGFSTIEHTLTVNQLIEKSEEYNFELYLFIDFHKTFDTVNYNHLWRARLNQLLEIKIIKILPAIYKNLKACVKTDRKGPTFYIQRK